MANDDMFALPPELDRPGFPVVTLQEASYFAKPDLGTVSEGLSASPTLGRKVSSGALLPMNSAASYFDLREPKAPEEFPPRESVVLAPNWCQTKIPLVVDATTQSVSVAPADSDSLKRQLAAALRRAEVAESELAESRAQNCLLRAAAARNDAFGATATPYQDLREELLKTKRLEAELADVRAKLLDVESFKVSVLSAVRDLKREVSDLAADASADMYGRE